MARPNNRVLCTLTSLVSALAAACWETASDDTSAGAGQQPAPPVSTACFSTTTQVTNALPQVNGAFCFGLAAIRSDFLACSYDGRQTLCADEVAGVAYVVTWLGTRGTVTGQAGQTLGAVVQLAIDRYEIEGLDLATAATEPIGLCTLDMSTAIGTATFCAYE